MIAPDAVGCVSQWGTPADETPTSTLTLKSGGTYYVPMSLREIAHALGIAVRGTD